MRSRRTLFSLSLLFAFMGSSAAIATEPAISASLIDRNAKAMKGWATVEAKVTGLELVDSPTGEVREGQGHLHYRVDNESVVATTATKLSFHGLTAGKHRIEVRLVGNDHKALGPVTTLDLTVPRSVHN